MKIGKYRDLEIGWDRRMFAKGSYIVANFEERFFTILGISFIVKKFIERENVTNLR